MCKESTIVAPNAIWCCMCAVRHCFRRAEHDIENFRRFLPQLIGPCETAVPGAGKHEVKTFWKYLKPNLAPSNDFPHVIRKGTTAFLYRTAVKGPQTPSPSPHPILHQCDHMMDPWANQILDHCMIEPSMHVRSKMMDTWASACT